MRTTPILALATLVASTVAAHSQTSIFQAKQSVTSDARYSATNSGIFGLDPQQFKSAHIVPRNSGNSYIFGSGVWFGARKRLGDRLQPASFITYNPNSGKSWARPGEATFVPGMGRSDLFYSGDYDRTSGLALGASDAPNWPLWLRPGQTSTTSDPGSFVPSNDDRHTATGYAAPAFLPDVAEQFFSRFHDADTTLYEERPNGVMPIGLQFSQHIYSWATGRYKNVVVVRYDVVNRSGDTLFDCSIGAAVDPDLGDAKNDHMAYLAQHPELRTAAFWTEPEGARSYGTLLVTLLEGPVVDDNNFVDNRHRGDYRDNGRIGTARNWTVDNDPRGLAERYAFMISSQHDGDNGAGDKRGLFATTRFNMAPGDTIHFAVAYSVIPHSTPIEDGATAAVELLSTGLIGDYFGATTIAAVQGDQMGIATTRITPNPARDAATISFSLKTPSYTMLRIVDNLGRTVSTRDLGSLGAGSHTRSVDVAGLDAGVYHVTIESGATRSTASIVIAR